MSWQRALYSLLHWCAMPLVLVRLAVRAFGNRDYLSDIGDRHLEQPVAGLDRNALELQDAHDQLSMPGEETRRAGFGLRIRRDGSVAAPTAGLHFTEGLLRRLNDGDIETHYVTLHVGLDTFRPITAARLGIALICPTDTTDTV